MGNLLQLDRRATIAELINCALLTARGEVPQAQLEQLIRQLTVVHSVLKDKNVKQQQRSFSLSMRG